ncbi:MAG: diguanylate cyclase [Rhodospirillaceae bacterium]
MQRETLNILLVEDNIGDARLIEVLLAEEAGQDLFLTHVTRLADAVGRLHAARYDVVLLDLSLPDSHGLETVVSLRRQAGNVPVVVLSGMDNEQVALSALQSGAEDYLVKGRADGNLIKRSILYALERHRIRQRVLLAEAAFSATDTGIVVLDTEFRIIRVNPAFTRLTGFAIEDMLNQPPFMLGSGEHEPNYHELILSKLALESAWEGEVWNRRKGGDVFPVWLRLNAVRDEGNTLSGYVAVLSDITHRKQVEAELVRQATRDALTGLPNRSLLRSLMQEVVARATQDGTGCAFLFVDLDGFKAVNDTHGHDVGDELLKDAARRLRAALRASDEVGRLGGDEFVVLLNDISGLGDAVSVAGKIVGALSEPFHIGSITASVSASVGVAVFPDDGTEADALLKMADEAMYEAKKGGKNQWRAWRHATQGASAAG